MEVSVTSRRKSSIDFGRRRVFSGKKEVHKALLPSQKPDFGILTSDLWATTTAIGQEG